MPFDGRPSSAWPLLITYGPLDAQPEVSLPSQPLSPSVSDADVAPGLILLAEGARLMESRGVEELLVPPSHSALTAASASASSAENGALPCETSLYSCS